MCGYGSPPHQDGCPRGTTDNYGLAMMAVLVVIAVMVMRMTPMPASEEQYILWV